MASPLARPENPDYITYQANLKSLKANYQGIKKGTLYEILMRIK